MAKLNANTTVMRPDTLEVVTLAEGDEVPDWAAVAADLGYFDQSHLIGDFRRVFGMPPAEYARSRR